nr:11621_t:CDS:2 [Entrophospora candida]
MGLAKSAGKEDPVELDSSSTLGKHILGNTKEPIKNSKGHFSANFQCGETSSLATHLANYLN